MNSTGEVQLDLIAKQADALIRQGVQGVYICGTTGEGMLLTSDERRAVAEKWVAAAGSDLRVIVHVGHTSLREAQALAAHSEEIGAWASSAVAPSYFKPDSVASLVDCMAQIAAAAPTLPFYFYHSPGLTGVDLSPLSFLAEADGRIPNLAGIKFNDGNLFEYQRCLAFRDGHYDIPFGVDEALLGGLAVGAKGAVGSTYNYAAGIYLEMIDAFAAGDLLTARARAADSVNLVEMLLRYGVLAAGKALMGLHGADCGPPRKPLAPLTEQNKTALLAEAEASGWIRLEQGEKLVEAV